MWKRWNKTLLLGHKYNNKCVCVWVFVFSLFFIGNTCKMINSQYDETWNCAKCETAKVKTLVSFFASTIVSCLFFFAHYRTNLYSLSLLSSSSCQIRCRRNFPKWLYKVGADGHMRLMCFLFSGIFFFILLHFSSALLWFILHCWIRWTVHNFVNFNSKAKQKKK